MSYQVKDLTFEEYDKNNENHFWGATFVGIWSADARMTLLTHAKLAKFPYSLLAMFKGPDGLGFNTAGHIAVAGLEAGKAAVGGYVVNEVHRGKGFGQALIDYLLATAQVVLPDIETCYTHANEASLSQFEKAGGVVLGERQTSPWTDCKYVVDLTPALKGSGHEN